MTGSLPGYADTKTPRGFGDLSRGVGVYGCDSYEVSMAATVRNMQADAKVRSTRPEVDCKYCEGGSTLKIRRRTISNGCVQYVWHCQTCGRTPGSAIKQALVLDAYGEEPPHLDQGIAEEWRSEQAELRLVAQQAKDEAFNREREEHARWYHEYLTTARWHSLRQRVLARCGGRCEGCGQREAEEVHHLTYEHVGNEFLFELIGLCGVCHARVHNIHQWQSINPFPVIQS